MRSRAAPAAASLPLTDLTDDVPGGPPPEEARPGSSATSERPPGRFRRHRPKLIVGLIVLGIAATIGVTIASSRKDGKPAARGPVPTTQPSGDSSDSVAELVRLLDAGSKLAFDGRYTVSQDGGGAPSTVRLWQKPTLIRLDTESGSGADIRRTAQFALPSGPVSCTRQPDGAWTCKSEPGLRLRSGVVPETILSQLARLTVESRDDRIGGVDARCFSIVEAGAKRAEVCLTPDGVPLRVLANSIGAQLAELHRSPPLDEIFAPPAPVS